MSVIWVPLIIYTSLLLILRLFKVHFAVTFSITESWQSFMVVMHHCRIWSTISQHAHICSAYVLVTWHIHPTLWHLCFDPPISQVRQVFVYETGLIETQYNAGHLVSSTMHFLSQSQGSAARGSKFVTKRSKLSRSEHI